MDTREHDDYRWEHPGDTPGVDPNDRPSPVTGAQSHVLHAAARGGAEAGLDIADVAKTVEVVKAAMTVGFNLTQMKQFTVQVKRSDGWSQVAITHKPSGEVWGWTTAK